MKLQSSLFGGLFRSKMKLQSSLFGGLLLLLISTWLPVNVADPEWRCKKRDYYGGDYGSHLCEAGELCGIEEGKSRGEVQGCVSASLCPDDVAEEDYDYKIRCNKKKTYCCCKSTQPNDHGGIINCNDILNEDDDTIWKQACSLPELKPATACRANPTTDIYCAKSEDKYDYEDCRGPRRPFCGIDRRTGKIQGCVETDNCPDTAGGLPIVCDPGKPSCCCQTTQKDFYGDRPLACNNYLNPEDSSIWKQACSLPELKMLEQCKAPPAPVTPSSTPKASSSTENGKVTTASSSSPEPASTSPSEEVHMQKKMEEMEKQKSNTAIIIVVVLIAAGIAIGVFVYFKFCKKRAQVQDGGINNPQMQQAYSTPFQPTTVTNSNPALASNAPPPKTTVL